MAALGIILNVVGLLVIRIGGPLQRWQGLRSGFRLSPMNNRWFWPLVSIILAAVVVCLLAGASGWVEYRRKRRWRVFNQRASRSSLSQEERSLLYNIAQKAGLRRLEGVFESQTNFEKGLATIEANPPSQDDNPGVIGSSAFVYSLRQKLGFDAPAGEPRAASVDLGQLPSGAILTVFRQDSPESFRCLAAGHGEQEELAVQVEAGISCHPGQVWALRYADGGMLWEFDCWVVRTGRGMVWLKPSSTLRGVNRRRFARSATSKRAHVARFPFERRPEEVTELPEFVPAELVEISGPGLRLRAPLAVSKGETLLVVVELRPGQAVEATAIVRRVDKQDEQGFSFAVELTGLGASAVAELSRQTNVVALEARQYQTAAVEEVAAAEAQI